MSRELLFKEAEMHHKLNQDQRPTSPKSSPLPRRTVVTNGLLALSVAALVLVSTMRTPVRVADSLDAPVLMEQIAAARSGR